MCASCARAAADYAAQQVSLRGLDEPIPPRDLWARTAAALDRAERQAGRDLPNATVFPGRGGLPGSRGARSIRGLRAEQRALAFRAGPRPLPQRLLVDRRPRAMPRAPGLGWVAPFGALAVVAVLIVVGGNALLNGSAVTPIGSPFSATATLAAAAAATPLATPFRVGAGDVAWLTPVNDGTYDLNFATVDRVCPTSAKPDCAPIAPAAPRKLPVIATTLHTVIRNPSKTQLVVVPTSTKKGSGGGSVVVVAVPTPVPTASAPVAASVPPSSATGSEPTAGATGSGGESSPANPASPAVETGPPTTPQPPASAASESPSSSVGSQASESPGSTITSAAASTSTPNGGSGPTGPTAAQQSASASPGPPATEPQPTATALAIINDVVVVGETASYSPDGTMLAFSARPADGSHGPDIYLWRPGDPTAQPVTTDHVSLFSGWLSNQLLGSRVVDGARWPASGGPTPSVPSDTSGTQPPASPSDNASSSEAASPVASDASPVASDASPVASDAAPASDPSASASGAVTNAEGAVSANFAVQNDVPAGATARSFVLDPTTLTETDLAAPAWRPVVDPSGRFVAYWAGTLRYDAASLTWIPDRGALVLASWPALRGTDPGAVLAPVPLLGDGTNVPSGEWDIRWDEAGTHVAIWAADADNPDLGRLTLLTIDATGRVDPTGIALHDAPALAGFSIGSDRLAWATPPGQDGEGSRLQVLAWSGENAGNIDSQPVSGADAVVVVR